MRPGEPFSAIVQSESMSYSSIVDRQREDENDVDDERDERNETSDQRFFYFWAGARITLLYRATPSLCPDTNRTLATARPARLPARDATGALPPPWRTACPRPWHPWRRLRRRRRRPLPRQTIYIQNAFLRLNMHVLVETQNRGTSHAHFMILETQDRRPSHAHICTILLCEGALSHDSDSDEPPPLLSSSDTDDARDDDELPCITVD